MPNNYLSVLYKHIIQVENKNEGLKVCVCGGHKHTIAPPPPPRFLRQCVCVCVCVCIYIYIYIYILLLLLLLLWLLLFNRKGEEWYRLRRPLQAKILRPAIVDQYIPAQNKVADDFVSVLSRGGDSDVSLENLLLRYAVECK